VPVLCLDTSAINNILDDPECSRLLALITSQYDVYVSVLNILEIAKTKNAERREALRAAAKQLGRDFEPLELPNHLVRQLCALHASRSQKMRWSIADERRQFWIAMSQPNSLGETEREEAITWA
jgi:predicted nucleic acid-binding protein